MLAVELLTSGPLPGHKRHTPQIPLKSGRAYRHIRVFHPTASIDFPRWPTSISPLTPPPEIVGCPELPLLPSHQVPRYQLPDTFRIAALRVLPSPFFFLSTGTLDRYGCFLGIPQHQRSSLFFPDFINEDSLFEPLNLPLLVQDLYGFPSSWVEDR